MSEFAGRRVLITGAASGLGLLMARKMGAAGAHLILWDVNAAGLETACGELESAGRTVEGDVCDLSSREAIEAAAARVLSGGRGGRTRQQRRHRDREDLARSDSRRDRAHLRRQRAGALLDHAGLPARHDGARSRSHRHDRFRRRDRRHFEADRLLCQQACRGRVRRVVAARAPAPEEPRRDHRRLPVLHQHGNVHGRADALSESAPHPRPRARHRPDRRCHSTRPPAADLAVDGSHDLARAFAAGRRPSMR